VATLVVAAGLATAGGGGPSAGAGIPATPLVEGLPGDLGLNQVQYVGSHNSYHVEPRPWVRDLVIGFQGGGTADADQLQYSHAPLAEQLGTMGVRQLELDVFADSEGGLYEDPALGPPQAGDPTPPLDRPEMALPGFKVLHIQHLDYETTCTTLIRCLDQVDAWSNANPNHLPVAILIEAKDAPLPLEYPPVPGGEDPEPMTSAAFAALDTEIRSVFDETELLTPDDVQGNHGTLEDAVLADDWPTLEESQGQVLFLLDNGGTYRTTYLDNGSDDELTGQPMFVSSPPGQPTAAFVKQNDPEGPNTAAIQQLVADGYVVRTRSDEPTTQARSGDRTQQQAAFASGAQWVSTDYPVPGIAARFDSTYFSALPGFHPGRCNPVSAPVGCEDPPGCRSPFVDVGSAHPFKEDVCWLAEEQISTGFSDRTFRSSAPVTRQAMAAFLHRFGDGLHPPPCTPTFSDVSGDHPFFEDVCWLLHAGVASGFSDGTFRPSAPVTRQAMAAFLFRFSGDAPEVGCTQQFSDVSTGHPFFAEICWLARSGITEGFPDSTFRPSAAVSRQAMAAFLHRFPVG
jgi:hypothetical protein